LPIVYLADTATGMEADGDTLVQVPLDQLCGEPGAS
jgi:hypothetical protein